MTTLPTLSLLPLLAAGFLFAAPATGFADRNVTVYRDNDGDGHYNKKSYEVNHGHGNYYGGNYYAGKPYGYGVYNRPYSYYCPYPYYAPRSFFGFTFSRSADPSSRSSYSDDLAVDVQRELRRRGYYRGAIDGDVGPGTREAIRRYQQERGLSVTGRIDRSLLRALGVS